MFHFQRFRRVLLRGACSLLVLSGLCFIAVHTSAGRRFVLAQVRIRIRDSSGLVLDAKTLDYNLFFSRFELTDVSLQGARLRGLSASLRAGRVEIAIPVSHLIRGSFDIATIRIDGLSVYAVTSAG